ncbi:MAG: ABC transporter permease [Acidimicrobiales bacterium]
MAAVTVPADSLGPADVARESMARRARYSITDSAALMRRNLTHIYRVPALIVFTAIQPIMFTLLFRYVFGGAIHTSAGSYVSYLIPGIVIQTAGFASVTTAIGLSKELSEGVIDRFRSMPIARSAVLLGRLGADSLRILLTVIILLAVGYAVGFRISTGFGDTIAMIALSVGFGIALCCVSAWIGLSLKDPESVQGFAFIWLFPVVFASGVFVPVTSMPGWLQDFARNNPVTLLAEAARNLTIGSTAGNSIWLSVVWIVGITAVFGVLAVRAYRKAV